MLCLCVLCALAAVGSSAATALPVTFSTKGNVYQYAVKGKDPDTVTYGAKTSAPVEGSVSAAPSGSGISVSLDTGDNQKFKLCYKEIPVTVTVPANTTYTVALKFELNGTYTRKSKNASAKASFQVVYLGDASADKTTVFYPYKKSGNTIKTTIGGSDANTDIVQITMDNATTVNRSETKSYDFVNNTSQAKDITKYFGVWIAGNYGSKFSNRARATCTVTPASYLVTFDPNGGKVSQESTAVTIGKPYGTLPTPNRTGYSFAGWYTEKTGGTEVKSDTTVGKDPPTRLYAHWTANKYLVYFDANGGEFNTAGGTVSKKNSTVTYGSKYNSMPTPTRTGGYNFAGWYTEATGGTEITSDTTVTTAKTHILYAHWHLTPARAPYNVKLRMDETGVYGERIYHNVSASLYPDHTQKRTWYECDKNGDNGILLTDENGAPTYPTTPTAGVHYYYVVVTATRKDNGQEASTKSDPVRVTVTKATPTISTKPTAAALDLAVGNTLAASALTGGVAKNYKISSGSNEVAGHFAWKDATVTVKPPLGWQYYAVVFQPDDTANYEPTETTVKVQVTCSHSDAWSAWNAGRRTCTACGEKETRYNTVTVTWGALAYTYTDGTWNPATHAYDIGGGWKPNQANDDAITVQNESADEVHVRFQYTKTNTAISGSFVNSDGDPIYSAKELPINRAQTVWLRLTGRPNTALNNTKIGSVTVRLER